MTLGEPGLMPVMETVSKLSNGIEIKKVGSFEPKPNWRTTMERHLGVRTDAENSRSMGALEFPDLGKTDPSILQPFIPESHKSVPAGSLRDFEATFIPPSGSEGKTVYAKADLHYKVHLNMYGEPIQGGGGASYPTEGFRGKMARAYIATCPEAKAIMPDPSREAIVTIPAGTGLEVTQVYDPSESGDSEPVVTLKGFDGAISTCVKASALGLKPAVV